MIDRRTLIRSAGAAVVASALDAPAARADKAAQVELQPTPAETAETLIEAIFAKTPAIESDLAKLAAGF